MNRFDALIAKLPRGPESEPPAFPRAAVSTRPCCLPENRLFRRAGNFSVLANVFGGGIHPEWWIGPGRPGTCGEQTRTQRRRRAQDHE